MVAGLATITPASGNVGPLGATLIGALAGFVCYFACGFIKNRLKIDDALDVFAVHGIGGIMGSILVAVFGTTAFGGTGVTHVGAQLLIQLKAVGFTAVWSAVGTTLIVLLVRSMVGLRVNREAENVGLDRTEHGESAYHLD
jgi:Amt family ammonium transporter